MLPLITERQAELMNVCRRFGVRRLALFGSAARLTDFDSERSDVDFLVAFDPAASPSLAEYLALRDALAAVVGRAVDLVVEGSVRNPFIRAGIERSAETVYGP
jgi:predicted nucleotidyltransferase